MRTAAPGGHPAIGPRWQHQPLRSLPAEHSSTPPQSTRASRKPLVMAVDQAPHATRRRDTAFRCLTVFRACATLRAASQRFAPSLEGAGHTRTGYPDGRSDVCRARPGRGGLSAFHGPVCLPKFSVLLVRLCYADKSSPSCASYGMPTCSASSSPIRSLNVTPLLAAVCFAPSARRGGRRSVIRLRSPFEGRPTFLLSTTRFYRSGRPESWRRAEAARRSRFVALAPGRGHWRTRLLCRVVLALAQT